AYRGARKLSAGLRENSQAQRGMCTFASIMQFLAATRGRLDINRTLKNWNDCDQWARRNADAEVLTGLALTESAGYSAARAVQWARETYTDQVLRVGGGNVADGKKTIDDYAEALGVARANGDLSTAMLRA